MWAAPPDPLACLSAHVLNQVKLHGGAFSPSLQHVGSRRFYKRLEGSRRFLCLSTSPKVANQSELLCSAHRHPTPTPLWVSESQGPRGKPHICPHPLPSVLGLPAGCGRETPASPQSQGEAGAGQERLGVGPINH